MEQGGRPLGLLMFMVEAFLSITSSAVLVVHRRLTIMKVLRKYFPARGGRCNSPGCAGIQASFQVTTPYLESLERILRRRRK